MNWFPFPGIEKTRYYVLARQHDIATVVDVFETHIQGAFICGVLCGFGLAAIVAVVSGH